MPASKTPEIAEIARAISGRVPRGASPLYRWMFRNFHRLQKESFSRANWTVATEEINKLGLGGPDDPPFKAVNVRAMWLRVARARAKFPQPHRQRRKPPTPPPVYAPGEQRAVSVGRPLMQTPLPAHDPEDDEAPLIEEPSRKFSGRRPVDRAQPPPKGEN